jgi:hypothetical protein
MPPIFRVPAAASSAVSSVLSVVSAASVVVSAAVLELVSLELLQPAKMLTIIATAMTRARIFIRFMFFMMFVPLSKFIFPAGCPAENHKQPALLAK